MRCEGRVHKTVACWLALTLAVLAIACSSGGSSSTPTSPSPSTPTPAPTPTPEPEPEPTPGPAALSSLVLSAGVVPGQSQPTATVTLSAAAPSGGAVIRLGSNNTAAKIPASVTVAAGSTSATFTVDTATVSTRVTITLTATYDGVAKTAALTVTLPTPRASFTVVSPTRGTDACLLIASGRSLDCRLDARASEGSLKTWIWELKVVERVVAERPDPTWSDIDVSCELFGSVTTSRDSVGKYANMTIKLEVRDRDDSTSSATSKTVKVYTNDHCGV